ncbi:hypothetical protein [Acidihalobacter ferrooxydans]|uniref:Uncharacterized protein n=1 Tax=Acidihalobacter ferrooxydans TaxID=1765967 RepID=A0A1P8UFR9_9GAMM|nr:hypothetical protein [Acidihalobacter ferrooxydans]APZ42594.1 hypothetical protein BW247_05360 [Acidihalobacter ferrooxydans]
MDKKGKNDEAFSGWTEDGLDDVDEGYLEPEEAPKTAREGTVIDHTPEPVEENLNEPLFSGKGAQAEHTVPPSAPDWNDEPDEKSSGRRIPADKLKKAVGLVAAVVVVIVGGALYHKHQQSSTASPIALTPVHPSTPVHTQAVSPARTAADSVHAKAASSPASPVHPQSAPAVATPQKTFATAPSMATQAPSSTPVLLGAVSDIKSQLATLETQLANQRQQGVSKKAIASIEKQVGALHSALTLLRVQIADLTNKMKVGTAAHPVLAGYRLIAVIGDQAVIEQVATNRVAVLGTNGNLGNLTVYQVGNGQVVTNYGVFSAQ